MQSPCDERLNVDLEVILDEQVYKQQYLHAHLTHGHHEAMSLRIGQILPLTHTSSSRARRPFVVILLTPTLTRGLRIGQMLDNLPLFSGPQCLVTAFTTRTVCGSMCAGAAARITVVGQPAVSSAPPSCRHLQLLPRRFSQRIP